MKSFARIKEIQRKNFHAKEKKKLYAKKEKQKKFSTQKLQ
jgi:hypothetical protein